MWIALGVLLAATVFVRNLYCRFLCPVGATLGLMSYLTVFRIKRWSECNTCKICQKACQWGAIDGPKILMTECVRCDDCERLYADTAICPHWRIIEYNSSKIAILPLQPVPRSPEINPQSTPELLSLAFHSRIQPDVHSWPPRSRVFLRPCRS